MWLSAAQALAATETDRAAETELDRHIGERRLGDERRAQLREVAFQIVRELRVEQVRDAEVQDRITEELQPLVRLDESFS